MKAGDTIVAANHLMDFTSVPLTLGNRYIADEIIPPAYPGGMELVVINETDNGKRGVFGRARFKKDQ